MMKHVFRHRILRPPAAGFSGPAAILAVMAILVASGCTDYNPHMQGSTTAIKEKHDRSPAMEVTAALGTGAATTMQAMKQPAAEPVSSTGVIRIDPVSDMNAGEKFTLTGTTSLPEDSEIIWQVIPDTGSPPEGIDPDSTMSVGGNYLVTRGDGTTNRIAITVDTDRLVPGRYVIIAGKAGERKPGMMAFEIGKDFGFTCFSLK